MIQNPEFFKTLVAKGIITENGIEELLFRCGQDALKALSHLLQGRLADEAAIGKLWGDSIGVSFVDLQKTIFDPQVVQSIPESFARKHRIIPLYSLGGTITVATSSPENKTALSEAQRLTGSPVSPVFALPHHIDSAIEVQYRTINNVKDISSKVLMSGLIEHGGKITKEQLERIAGSESVIELSREIILLGIKDRASDIHIDPGEDAVRIRFRIDGILQDKLRLEKDILSPLASRLKILAGVDIVERRLPQDGRIGFPLPNKSVDIRFSSTPIIHGEKLVLRILGQSMAESIIDLPELNFSRGNLEKLTRILDRPNGVFFVTGPTGSGKTTTLFSALKHLNKPGVNVMTIEDPVEYQLEGANQAQVNPEIGLDFAKALRSFLRQDPDVILVGEIRDYETARIAAQAALTGHLVLATMHTNDSLQAVLRLIEIGVEPFLVAPSIIGAMGQRLVRKICEHCKERYAPSPEEIHSLFLWDGKKEIFFHRGKGCPRCNGTGYSGRIAIHEVLVVDDAIRRLITKEASMLEIAQCAKAEGFRNMHYDGIKKVLRGMTTLQEVTRVCQEE